MDYGAIAGVLERSEAACRQLASRARDHIRDRDPHARVPRSPEVEARLFAAFGEVLASGNLEAFGQVLAADAILYSDGGGKRSAALRPIYGRAKILRFFAAIVRKRPPVSESREVRINGMPGYVMRGDDGVETLSIEVVGEHIVAIYAVRNPDKLKHLA
jgi:RNA polymerase sigma-70 factor (ECF subfamily)